MMLPPNPGDLDLMIRDRQEQLRISRPIGSAPIGGWRVRIGHALIAAGTTLSGEQSEQSARPSAHPRPA